MKGRRADADSARRAAFGWVFMLAPLSVFFFFSLTRSVKLNWTGPVWLALIPFMAYYMVSPGSIGVWHHRLRRVWPATIALILLVYGIGLQYLTLGLPGIPYPPGMPAVGRLDLGRQIERLEDEIEARTGFEPLVVGMDLYQTASLLAFYRQKAEAGEHAAENQESVRTTASNHLFGGNGLMYRYWFPNITGKGRVLILVSRQRKSLEDPTIKRRVEEFGEIQEITVHKNGKPAARHYYSVVRGYRSDVKLLKAAVPSTSALFSGSLA